ncbi:MAG: hypothetical protein HC875_35540 [Anaerolineales bacterium]|nr:hypothetical protein [Anaerolineales bacterium]
MGNDGKPQLIARSKQAGFDGLRLRVKIEAPPALPAPAAPSRKEAKSGEGKEEAAPSLEAELPPPPPNQPQFFNLVVERQSVSGAWQTKELLREVALAEVTTTTGKEVRLTFKNNKVPQWVELLIADPKAPWPKSGPKARSRR